MIRLHCYVDFISLFKTQSGHPPPSWGCDPPRRNDPPRKSDPLSRSEPPKKSEPPMKSEPPNVKTTEAQQSQWNLFGKSGGRGAVE